MPKRIESADAERLSRLSGVSSFDKWKRQLEEQNERIDGQLTGTIDEAWAKCLPIWLALGRVRDLSRRIRVPKYFPCYATQLGVAFVDRFWTQYPFIVDVLRSSPLDSHEYLCAFDLLDLIACDADESRMKMLDALFAIDLPIPSVVQLETAYDVRYAGLSTVGEFLRRIRDVA